jgi:hypothetical protein
METGPNKMKYMAKDGESVHFGSQHMNSNKLPE